MLSKFPPLKLLGYKQRRRRAFSVDGAGAAQPSPGPGWSPGWGLDAASSATSTSSRPINPHVRRLGARLCVHVEVAPLRRRGGRSLRPPLR